MAIASIDRAVASAGASSSLKHSLLKGRFREIAIGELIRPFLTPHTKIATGTIVDHHGNQSSQIDVILYDERITPPVLMAPAEGAIPCHSVLATIEVKSRLNMTELKKSVENARSVKLLKYDYDTIPFSGELGYEKVFQQQLLKMLDNNNLKEQIRHHLFDVSSPACFVFAFRSDLSNSRTIVDEQARLQGVVDAANTSADHVAIPISGLCVADRGFTFCTAFSPDPPIVAFENELPDFHTQPRPRGRKYWASHNVVLKFESMLQNTCAKHAHERWRIPLNVYFKE